MQGSRRLMTIIEGLLFIALSFGVELVFPDYLGDGHIQLSIGIIFIIFYAFRRGFVPALLAGIGFGLLAPLSSTTDWFNQPLAYAVLVLACASLGLAGLFARNLQRTLHNSRYSSVYLNLVTGTILATAAYYVLDFLNRQFILGQEAIGLAELAKYSALSWALNSGIIVIILIVILNTTSKYFIPRNTPFISRKERSRLLND
ncbi:hypothetical protein AWM75_02755 [Aerococcus urinaehominis]|uniref:Uncharacterized protein n=1 Tax=Aerococcus urinaehominis TaxID=128944 RepID=A0A0X8FKM9_9LACT|nr:energy-coupled thiamine transporter ThiT [Aerococcus urinaehominis]AMB98982.1 hypothetical protein AWM75_02755 [Aerococcus urinaehominis]SDM37813.1 energy-coupled thiamine transporter ThiT [Aerococcus urinaehominis]